MAAEPQTSVRSLKLTMQREKAKSATVFMGAGRITSALVAGLRLANDRRHIMVYDRNPGKMRVLRRASKVEIAPDLKSALRSAEILILAVRPHSVAEALQELAASGSPLPRICVSLAAGIPLAQLKTSLPTGLATRWVRAMPSPVSRMGRGLTALCFDRHFPARDRRTVRELFSRVGTVIEISEDVFDAFTATYSSSHGYHALATLSQAANRAGLDEKTALIAAAHALADGISYWRESGLSLEELLHEAATPGGIAAATMNAMDRAGFGRAVSRGLRAGIDQARRNARR